MIVTPTRIVRYRYGHEEADFRPAIVVTVNEDLCNVVVFLDGDETTDFVLSEKASGFAKRRGVPEGDGVGEWSWPPRV